MQFGFSKENLSQSQHDWVQVFKRHIILIVFLSSSGRSPLQNTWSSWQMLTGILAFVTVSEVPYIYSNKTHLDIIVHTLLPTALRCLTVCAREEAISSISLNGPQ